MLDRIRHFRVVTTAIVVLLTCAVTGAANAGVTVIYVDASAPDGGDGLSWVTAFNDLQMAISAADTAEVTQLWVRAGTYIPQQFYNGNPRFKPFVLRENSSILGGFNGTETSAEQRDPEVNVTILSGDIGTPGDFSDNTLRLVWVGMNTEVTSVLDGLTITGANANESMDRGAAIFSDGEATIRNCKIIGNFATTTGSAVLSDEPLIFANCEFMNNDTDPGGATIALPNSRPSVFTDCLLKDNLDSNCAGGGINFTRCTFQGNAGASSGLSFIECHFIDNAGTAVRIFSSSANLDVVRCTFIGNGDPAGQTWAIQADNSNGETNISNCVFRGNVAGVDGGALRLRCDEINILNCLIVGNRCGIQGGGIHVVQGVTAISNCTIAYNECEFGAAGVTGHELTVDNTVLWGNSRNGTVDQSSQLELSGNWTVRHTCIQGLMSPYEGNGNIGSDPLFIDALGPDLVAGTDDDDLRLRPDSPCIDAGRNASVFADGFDLDGDFIFFEFTPFDVLDQPRFFDVVRVVDTGVGTPPIVDIGAIESDGVGEPGSGGKYVGPSGGSWFVASNWNNEMVPDADTDVVIDTEVLIDQPGAVASTVTVVVGGSLVLDGGTLDAVTGIVISDGGMLTAQSSNALLTTPTLILMSGSTFLLDDAGATIEVAELDVNTGATLAWNAGEIVVSSSLSSGEPIEIGCVDAARLELTNDAELVAPVVQVCASGMLQGTGTITSTVLNDGQVVVGNSIGVLTIDGDYEQSASGVLEIEMDGYVPGVGFDVLLVTDTVELDGTLDLVLLPAFQALLGGSQSVVLAEGGMDGEFATVNQPAGSFFFDVVTGLADPDTGQGAVRLVTLMKSSGPRLYVNAEAAGSGDGQSWATAARSLRGALAFADLVNTGAHDIGGGMIEEVWVQAGTYTPDEGTGIRTRSFDIGALVQVYGGFDGTETRLSERDWVANETILSGDLEGNDGSPGTFLNYDENAYHVVFMECPGFPCADPARLDGFTITGGNANEPDNSGNRIAAGVRGADGATYENLRIEYNQAVLLGSGMSAGSSTTVSFCAFVGNRCTSGGGALQVGHTSTIVDCLFDANVGEIAAISTSTTGDLLFERCTFQNNVGAQTVLVSTNEFLMIDCEFVGNMPMSSSGSALQSSPDTSLDVQGCVFSENEVFSFFSRGPLIMSDCAFSDNLATAFLASGPSQVSNTDFVNNVTTEDGFAGGTNVGGGSTGGVTFTNCDFLLNQGTEAGGLTVDPGSTATLIGGTFLNNSASEHGGDAMFNWGTLQFGSDVDVQGNVQNAWFLRPGGTGNADVMNLSGGLLNDVFEIQNNAARRGTVFMELGGLAPGADYDQINAGASSVVIEGGTLQFDFLDPYQPTPSDTFDLITGGSVTGDFEIATTVSALPGGLFFDLQNDVDSIVGTFVELFTEDTSLTFASLPVDAALADLNGDNLDDLLLLFAGASPAVDPGMLVVHLNAGFSGSTWQGFSAGDTSIAVGVDPREILIARFDGDEWTDVAVPNFGSDTISMLLNAGDGTGDLMPGTDLELHLNLIAAGAVPVNPNAANLIVHARELEKGDSGSSSFVLREYVNDGFGLFTPGQALEFPNVGTHDIHGADVDLDNDLDLVLLRGSNDRDVEIWHYNQVDGLYELVQTQVVGDDAEQLILADLNDDGYPDIITDDLAEETMLVLLNTADLSGLFDIRIPVFLGYDIASLRAVDLDLDSDTDLLFVAEGATEAPVLRFTRSNSAAAGEFALGTSADVGTAGAPLLMITGNVDDNAAADAIVFIDSNTAGAPVDAVVYRNELVPAPCPADIVSSDTFQPPPDGQVDGADLAYLLGEWGANPGSLADLVTSATFQPPPDGVVDGADLAVLLGAWGTCN